MRHNCSAVILAGGLNSRMDGRNKAFLEVNGKTILTRLLGRLQPIFGEIVLVTREPDLYADQPVKVVTDIYTARSSLTGIHAGISHITTDHAFVVPCDTPFLQTAVVQLLLDELDPALDVVVPFFDGHFQPLCAIYSKKCLAPIESMLDRDDFKIIDLFNRMEVRTVPLEKLKSADPEMFSFFNVNTPAALQACRELSRKND